MFDSYGQSQCSVLFRKIFIEDMRTDEFDIPVDSDIDDEPPGLETLNILACSTGIAPGIPLTPPTLNSPSIHELVGRYKPSAKEVELDFGMAAWMAQRRRALEENEAEAALRPAEDEGGSLQACSTEASADNPTRLCPIESPPLLRKLTQFIHARLNL
jgi:hypothetical protein